MAQVGADEPDLEPDLFRLTPARIETSDHLVLPGRCQPGASVSHYVMRRTGHGLTQPSYTGEGYMAVVHLRRRGARDMWRDGRHAVIEALGAGALTLHDLRQSLVFDLREAFRTVNFQIPRHMLVDVAHELGAAPASLTAGSISVTSDEVMYHLALALLPCLSQPADASRLFVDHLFQTIGVHLTTRYGGAKPLAMRQRGGLAPWQERRAKNLLLANLATDLTMRDLVTAAYFSRAFRLSTGVAPHRWMTEQRVTVAKHLLEQTVERLSDIALQAGFSDQSHLTRVFSKVTGVSPGQWRHSARF